HVRRRQIHLCWDTVRPELESRGRGASVGVYAPDRHGPSWPTVLRAGLCGGVGVHHVLGLTAVDGSPARPEPVLAPLDPLDRTSGTSFHTVVASPGAGRGLFAARLPSTTALSPT